MSTPGSSSSRRIAMATTTSWATRTRFGVGWPCGASTALKSCQYRSRRSQERLTRHGFGSTASRRAMSHPRPRRTIRPLKRLGSKRAESFEQPENGPLLGADAPCDMTDPARALSPNTCAWLRTAAAPPRARDGMICRVPTPDCQGMTSPRSRPSRRAIGPVSTSCPSAGSLHL